jgi:hypothetical protein
LAITAILLDRAVSHPIVPGEEIIGLGFFEAAAAILEAALVRLEKPAREMGCIL